MKVAKAKAAKKSVSENFKWAPKPGYYQCVIPNGQVHIDIYIDGRTPETATLVSGDEIELRERDIRGLRRSEILQKGYLAPLTYFEKDEEGNEVQVDATEDDSNPNVISDNFIFIKVQRMMGSAKAFKEHINKIDSFTTLQRFRTACVDLDTPQSFLNTIDDRIQHLQDAETKQLYVGPVDDRRKRFLSGPEASKKEE